MTDLKDFVQEVKRANDIVDVVGSYIELRQYGVNYKARCPFHGEKTASFNVNRNLQIYKCFGCQESGDVIKFVEKYESCSFTEALAILAKRANLKMPEFHTDKKDKQYEEKKKKRDVYLAILKETAIFYYKKFYSEAGEKARMYMQARGFDGATLKKFGIGFSPDYVSLPGHLKAKGFNAEDCAAAGVLQRRSDGTLYDALAGRLIVPVFNISGNVIAFGGRGLDEKTIQRGKYKNTSETPVFTKKDNLYAINVVKEQKQQSALPNIVVVEGYMDVIAMYQAGFRRCVASMGTSLTSQQAKLLSRLSNEVYICYDGDAAGQKATVRGLDILDGAGLEVKVITVPEKLDPDEFIKKYGAEAFEKLIEQALPLPDYKLSILDRAFPIDSVITAVRNDALPKYVKGAVSMLSKLDDVRRARYITAVSLKTGYPEDYFRRKLQAETETGEQKTNSAEPGSLEKAQYFVAACLLNGADYPAPEVKPHCGSVFLQNLYGYLYACIEKGEKPVADMLYTVCPDASEEEYSRVIDTAFTQEDYDKNRIYFTECSKLLVTEELKRKREVLLRRLRTEKNDYAIEILSEIEKINEKINSND